jgi:hypothetical protein
LREPPVEEISEALSRFEALANERGWSATHEEGGRAIRRGDACLRLRANGGRLLLEITHGIDCHIGWLDLWTEPSPGTVSDIAGGGTLAEAIDYGLDLMRADDESR